MHASPIAYAAPPPPTELRSAGRAAVATVLLGLLLAATGCVSFNGPNDVRKAIAQQENLELDQEMGVTVGPVAIFFANTLAGAFLPMNADGIDWVSYGEYTARCCDPSAETVCLRNLELPGWERIARICEPREEVIIMIPEEGETLKKLLVVMREEQTVRIVRAEGKIEKVIERMLESDLIDDEAKAFLAWSEDGDEPAECAGSDDQVRADPEAVGGMDDLTEAQRRALEQALAMGGWRARRWW